MFILILRQGLSKLLNSSGWAPTCNVFASASQSIGVAGAYHHSWLLSYNFLNYSKEKKKLFRLKKTLFFIEIPRLGEMAEDGVGKMLYEGFMSNIYIIKT